MSPAGQHHALTPGRERITLLALGAVQFTHILDFMIMMPLGAQLMVVFDISPVQFTHLVAAYGYSAAAAGFAGGFVLDRFDRKHALMVVYACFAVATLGCALAPTHHTLLLARIVAGAFGGLTGSLVSAMVSDIVPPGRRGQAMSIVMTAFPVASVFGVPLGLVLAARYNWHAPFFLLAGCAAVILVIAAVALPPIRTAVAGHQPLRQMAEIVSHGIHLRAFAVGAVLVMAGGVLIPFIAPSFVSNVGLDDKLQLPITYIAGGVATVLSMPLIGRLTDRVDRLKLLAVVSVAAIAVALGITHMGPASLAFASTMMALFMVTMSGRFAPAMTMVANAVEARYRGGFMSVNAALQQGASSTASVIAGTLVTRTADGRLAGMPLLGYASSALFILTVLLAARLRDAAPHVATPAAKVPAPAPTEVSV